MSSGPRFRFAPSPTGFFHVGGARTALYNWALAKRLGGTFVLRIEDTDEARNRPEWTQGIIEALAWLGIHQDDPTFEGPYFQSQYAAAHLTAAQRLFEAGAAYYCDLTSEQIQERAKAAGLSGYDGYSRDRGLGPAPGRVLRFRVPEGSTIVHDLVRGDVVFEHATIEDFVLLRGNRSPMFLLANVVDDIEMQITNVVRAEEHLPNTPKQQLLWQALGHQPPAWAHVPLLVNEQRKKLSKRRDKVAVEQYRAEGYLAEAMVNYLMTLGWSPPGDQEIVPWSVIEREFRMEDVNHSPAYFDLKKLTAFNGEYIRMLSIADFIAACEPFLHSSDVPWPAERFDAATFAAMAPVVQSRATTLAEVPGVVDFLFLADPVIDQQAWAQTIGAPSAREVLAEVTEAYRVIADWNAAALKETLESVGEKHGLKKGKAQAPVRVAITGRTVGPPLFEALEVMGREEVLRRLTKVGPA
jgi:glutamyl-tRNA synthetase